MKLYVGNISFDTSEESLRAAFSEFGEVEEVILIMDRETGRPRGFGFVSMRDESAARAAIEGLNGKDLDGRSLNVNEARAKTERSQGGGGGGGGRGRGRQGGW